MQKVILGILLLINFAAAAQEFSRSKLIRFARSVNQPLFTKAVPSLTPLYSPLQLGQFSLPSEESFLNPESEQMDIMAIAQERKMRQQMGMIDPEVANRQLVGIQSKTQVMFNQNSFNRRTNFDMDYYGRRTPDGGIKNEVYEDVRQPFMNPFYRSFNNPYYYRNRTNSRSGFYLTR